MAWVNALVNVWSGHTSDFPRQQCYVNLCISLVLGPSLEGVSKLMPSCPADKVGAFIGRHFSEYFYVIFVPDIALSLLCEQTVQFSDRSSI